jgi:outer membrane protein W
MKRLVKAAVAGLALAACAAGASVPAMAGDDHGDFMVRALVTGVLPDTDATVKAGGAVIPGADADVSDEVIPATTLTYFFNDNISLELFCCFAKHAWGFTLQAGLDVSIGNGWFLNADVKKTWLDTDITWAGTGITASADLDPLIISAGFGYRFNLSDIFGHRTQTASIPMK